MTKGRYNLKKEQNERSSSIETKCLFVTVIIIIVIIIIFIIIIIIIRIIKPSLAFYPLYSHCYRLVWNVSLPHPLTHRERTPIGEWVETVDISDYLRLCRDRIHPIKPLPNAIPNNTHPVLCAKVSKWPKTLGGEKMAFNNVTYLF